MTGCSPARPVTPVTSVTNGGGEANVEHVRTPGEAWRAAGWQPVTRPEERLAGREWAVLPLPSEHAPVDRTPPVLPRRPHDRSPVVVPVSGSGGGPRRPPTADGRPLLLREIKDRETPSATAARPLTRGRLPALPRLASAQAGRLRGGGTSVRVRRWTARHPGPGPDGFGTFHRASTCPDIPRGSSAAHALAYPHGRSPHLIPVTFRPKLVPYWCLRRTRPVCAPRVGWPVPVRRQEKCPAGQSGRGRDTKTLGMTV